MRTLAKRSRPQSAYRNSRRTFFSPRRLRLESLESRSLLATSPVQVILMIGQSNIGGYPSTADLSPPLDAPQSDVWIWQDDLAENVGWTSLRGGFGGDTSNFGSGGDGDQFGPEVPLGRALADASPDSQYALIKHVQAGTAATMHDGWNPDRGGGAGPGQLWIDFVAKTHEALDALSASQTPYEVAGLLVFQGNRDAVNETGVEAAGYEQNFTDFINGVRQEFGAPQMPVVFTELPEYRVVGSGASGYENTLLVRNGQKAVDAAVPFTTMIEANDFSRISDGTHFDAEGQIGLGQRFADAYLGLPFEGSARVGSDGFESGTLNSGFEQWSAGAWTVSGTASVTTAGIPFDNAYHVQLTSSTAELTRAVNSTGLINEKLRFWSKLESFESGDKAFVKVSADGTNWITVQEFVDGQDDSVYRYYEIDLPDIGNTIYVRFDAGMNDSTDYWYLDDVIIEGTTPPGSVEFTISDATATEGATSYRFLDAFVATQSGGLDWPRSIVFHNTDLFVASLNTSSILRYDGNSGAFLGEFVTSGSGGLNGPFDLAFGPDGNLYVTSFNGTYTVIRYDGATGDFLDTFVAAGSGGLTDPTGLAFDANGDLLVSSYSGGAVLKYQGPDNTSPGAFIDVFANTGTGSSPDHIAFGPDGNLYVGATGHQTPTPFDATILRYNGVTGAPLGTFVPTGSGGFQDVRQITFDAQGDLLFADPAHNAVLHYQGPTGANPGAFLGQAVSPGLGGLSMPIGVGIGPDGRLYVTSRDSDQVLRYEPNGAALFTVSLSSASSAPVTVDFATANGSAGASDFTAASGTITFAPGQTSRTILVQSLDDSTFENTETFTVNLTNPVGGVIVDGQGVGTITDNDLPPTKFYVADDGSANKTFEYAANGTAIENYAVNSGNTAPRGAASNASGNTVWVVDANKRVYVYNTSGGLLGSWTAGSLPSNASVQGIATNGTDVWIVDDKGNKVYKYAGAASRLSGSQNAASSFSLNGSNTSPTDLVTDGTSIWVLNNSSTDKVFKYTVGGSLLGSWTISGGGGSPTGITIDPTNVSNIWIVDSSSDRVYQFDTATGRTSGSQSPSTSFALAAGNTNPQGLADPPAASAPTSTTAQRSTTSDSSSFDSALLSVVGELEDLLAGGKKRK